MSRQFFYMELKFTPKIRTGAMPILHQHAAVIEVPKDLVHSRQSESTHQKAIAIDLAKRAALMTFPTGERVVGLYEEDSPTWCEDRPHVMNERPCDHEENGTRAWRID